MDLIDIILEVYIIQKYKDGIQYLVAYYNKKLLAIVIVLKKQRAFL